MGLGSGATFFGRFRKSHNVLIFHETELFDPRLDPVSEVPPDAEPLVQLASGRYVTGKPSRSMISSATA